MRYFKFKLRTFLIVVTVLGVSLGWVVSNINASRNEDLLIAQLDRNLKLGGTEIIDSSYPLITCGSVPASTSFAARNPTNFLNRFAGRFWPNVFERITELTLTDEQFCDDSIDVADQLPYLTRLAVFNCTISSSRLDRFRKTNPDVTVVVYVPMVDDMATLEDDDPFGPEATVYRPSGVGVDVLEGKNPFGQDPFEDSSETLDAENPFNH